MKLKSWPLLAFILLGLSLVLHKVHIVKNDTAQKVEKSTNQTPGIELATAYLVDPVPAQVEPNTVKDERSGGIATSLQFGAGGNDKRFPIARSQISQGEEPANDGEQSSSGGVWAFLWANIATILWALIALIEVVVRLTPSEKDNSILSYITQVLSKIVPNRRVGGGTL